MNGNLDKKNGFLYAKAAVAALCGAFTAAFGWLGWLVLAWAACMALDWLSGSAAAASRGFRKGSDLCDKVNEIMATLNEDGTLQSLAEKYGLSL